MAIINELSDLLSVDTDTLSNFIASAPHRYKVYQIPKRNNKGFRTIAQPTKGLKNLQKIACSTYLESLPVHSACKAYIKNTSIKDNATLHIKKKYLLKMDFKDFFPSILPSDLQYHLIRYSKLKFTDEDLDILSKLFFYFSNEDKQLRLSIGAPTSPFISNTVMYDFDSSISKLCLDNEISYSRYADDIAFSTNRKDILFDFLNTIESTLKACQYPKININPSKTIFLSRKGNMHLTGLVLTNEGNISIGRKKKRYIKSLVFQYKNGELEADASSYLSGYLSFCLSVEPLFIARLKEKFGHDVVDLLLKKPRT